MAALEEINKSNHPLLDNTIVLLKRRLRAEQVSDKNEFIYALVHRRSWFPDKYHLLIIREGNSVLAAGAGYYIADVNAGFINYVVVDENYASRGLATTIRNKLIELFVEDAGRNNFKEPIGYLGEVERENPWLKVLIRKYSVIPLDVNYFQPPLKKGKKATPLVLYFQPHSKAGIKVEKAFVEKIVRAIYKNVYDIAETNKNTHFRKIMESLK